MGAWSWEVLTNDDAVDAMKLLSKSNDLKNDVRKLLDSEYIFKQLLAVEIVDVSINGLDKKILGSLYGYAEWFEALTKNPMIDLKEHALYTISKIKSEDIAWGAMRVVRRQLLEKIESRLKAVKYSEMNNTEIRKITYEECPLKCTGCEALCDEMPVGQCRKNLAQMEAKKDNSAQIMEDIKEVLFDDREYSLSVKFETWNGDGHSFIVKDKDGLEYRITVTREL